MTDEEVSYTIPRSRYLKEIMVSGNGLSKKLYQLKERRNK